MSESDTCHLNKTLLTVVYLRNCSPTKAVERNKLDIVARRCILVGYGNEVKGYRLYDPDRKNTFFSRDVKFNESEVGFKESGVVERVELEAADDSHTEGEVDVHVDEAIDMVRQWILVRQVLALLIRQEIL